MFHTANRKILSEKLKGQLIILAGHDLMQLSNDMEAPFLQESNFWWLTGVELAGWKLILDTTRNKSVLVRPDRSDVDITFNGDSDDDEIRKISGIHEIIAMREFEARLRDLHRQHTIAYTLNPKRDFEFVLNPAQHNLELVLKRIFDSVQYCGDALNETRAIKRPEEIKRTRSAISLTIDAYNRAKEALPTCKTESEVMAEFTYIFQKSSADHAYQPVVASGKNACVLHYIKNNQKFNSRDMVLIDIGARVDGYTADITRTYCRNPTKRQIQVHSAVQKAQAEIIDLIKPDLLLSEYFKLSDEIMKHALVDIGLLSDINDDKTYRRYMPHSIGHGLGVDVHDSLGRPKYFKPGMIVTVEPGIYIKEESIGVRIEDDILVTETGHDNLTGKLSTDLTI